MKSFKNKLKSKSNEMNFRRLVFILDGCFEFFKPPII